MAVIIKSYSNDLVERFELEKERLQSILGNETSIEHVGSSAVGIGGKNIVDILVGVKNCEGLASTRDLLAQNGYFEGNDSHEDRIFMASMEGETGEGDFHIHICVNNSETYLDFIRLRDYLKRNPKVANEYLITKQRIAKEAGFDRKKYRALKSKHVDELLSEARKQRF